MPKIQEIYNILNQIAPFGSALPYDNAGLLVGDADRQVQKIGVCLDITAKAIDAAVAQDCDLIVSHHPVIFDPLKQIDPTHPVYRLISENIAAICAHTNLDAASGGVNDSLCEALGLTGIRPLEDPDFPGYPPIGRIGTLPAPMPAETLAFYCKQRLSAPDVRFSAASNSPVSTLAVCGGAGADLLLPAYAAGADALLTSEIKQHQWLQGQALQFTLLDAGHFSTENCIVPALVKQLTAHFQIPVVMLAQTPPYQTI